MRFAAISLLVGLTACVGDQAPSVATQPPSQAPASPTPTLEPTPSARDVCEELVSDLIEVLNDFRSRSSVGLQSDSWYGLVGDMQVEADRIQRQSAETPDACTDTVVEPLLEAVAHHRDALAEWDCSSAAGCAFVDETEIQTSWAQAAFLLEDALRALDVLN